MFSRCFLLYNQPHIFHALAVFGAGADDINSRGVDATMTEDVGEFGDVLFDAVEYTGEQMPKIMREHFLRIDICFFTKRFHIMPDIRSADRFSAARNENTSLQYPLLRRILEQFLF